MIPIRDVNPRSNTPIVNNTLIGINIVFFLVEMAQGPDLNQFIYTYGLVPARYSVPQISDYFSFSQQVISFISFMFLHGGFWHLLGNMWSLYIFGDNVEDDLGPVRYLFFYLACGIGSGVAHLVVNFHSNVPTIGASGAIAGVMGAYLILHPRSKILTLIPILFIPWFVEIPAYFFLGIWFLFQFLNAAGSTAGSAGIAWWAHIGGFIFGIVLLKLFSVVPATGYRERMRPLTAKKRTDRLQVIQPAGSKNDIDLYGTLQISPFEASAGTRKLVNIPWGFHKRMFRVTVPPNVREGTQLRLRGMGRQAADGQKGDLLLTIAVG